MAKIFDDNLPFDIDRCDVRITIDKTFEIAKYDITFVLTKAREGNKIPLMSPMAGFELHSIQGPNHKDDEIDKYRDDLPDVVRYILTPKQQIEIGQQYTYTVVFSNELNNNIVPLEKRLFRKSYGLLMQRTFGTECNELNIFVDLEHRFARIKHTIPLRNSEKRNKFHKTSLHGGQPYTFAAVVEVGLPEAMQFIVFLAITGLSGYYIPKFFVQMMTWLTSN